MKSDEGDSRTVIDKSPGELAEENARARRAGRSLAEIRAHVRDNVALGAIELQARAAAGDVENPHVQNYQQLVNNNNNESPFAAPHQ